MWLQRGMDERPGAMEPGPALEVIAWKGHSKARRHRIAAGAGLGAGRGAVERTGEEGIGKKNTAKRESSGLTWAGGRAEQQQAEQRPGGGTGLHLQLLLENREQNGFREEKEQQNPTNQPGRIADGEGNGTSQPPNEEGRPYPPPFPPPLPFSPPVSPQRGADRTDLAGPRAAPGPFRSAPLRTAPPRRTASVALTPRAAPVAAGLPAARHRLALGTVVGGSPPPRDTGCCLLKVGRGGSFPTLRRRDAGKDGAAAAAREGLVAGAALMASGISQHGTQPGAVTGKAQRWWGRAVLPDGLGILCHPREHTVPAPN